MKSPQWFYADYYYQKIGQNSRARTKIKGSVSQHLRGATTESAVLSYLREKHRGCDVTLMRLDWQ